MVVAVKWFGKDAGTKKTEVNPGERAEMNQRTAAGMKAGAEHARDDIARGQTPTKWPK